MLTLNGLTTMTVSMATMGAEYEFLAMLSLCNNSLSPSGVFLLKFKCHTLSRLRFPIQRPTTKQVRTLPECVRLMLLTGRDNSVKHYRNASEKLALPNVARILSFFFSSYVSSLSASSKMLKDAAKCIK